MQGKVNKSKCVLLVNRYITQTEQSSRQGASPRRADKAGVQACWNMAVVTGSIPGS